MARSATGRPTDLELEVLKALWQRGSGTVREVWETLSESRTIGQTTVLKIMQIMREKDLLVCDRDKRPQVYRPRRKRQTVLRELAGDLLDRAFGGSTEQLVLHALEHKRATPEELAEIRRMLDRLKK